jgi:hypothetical protein
VYNFDESNPSKWSQKGSKLTGITAGERFGGQVSISGDKSRVIIGARFHNEPNAILTGEARVYAWVDSDWQQVGQTLVGDAANYHLGAGVSLNYDGSRAAVSASAANNVGQVEIYDYDAGSWTKTATLVGSTTNGGYGYRAVRLSSD